jgi:hypothetical protein
MATEGVRNIGIGGTIFVVGSLVTVATYSAAQGGGHYVVAWGAILFGGIQFLTGLGQFLLRDRSPIDRLLRDSTRPVKALVRAMIDAAQSDGALDEKKIAAMQAVLLRVDATHYPEKTIEDVAAAMRLDPTGTAQYLATVEYELTTAMKQQIIRGCVLAGGEGSRFTEQKDRLLRGFAGAMKMSEQEYVAVLDSVLRPGAPAAAAPSSSSGNG